MHTGDVQLLTIVVGLMAFATFVPYLFVRMVMLITGATND